MNPSDPLHYSLFDVLSEAELRCLIDDLGAEARSSDMGAVLPPC